MPDTNPISQVYTGIWTMLEASADFCTEVKAGNRIKHIGGTRHPDKPLIQSADTPQVAVLSLGCRAHPRATNDTSFLFSLWSIELVSGTQKLETIATLDWIVYRALLQWREVLRDALTYDGRDFVVAFRPKEIDEDMKERRAIRAPKGWASLWVGECEMKFNTVAIAPVTTTAPTTAAPTTSAPTTTTAAP